MRLVLVRFGCWRGLELGFPGGGLALRLTLFEASFPRECSGGPCGPVLEPTAFEPIAPLVRHGAVDDTAGMDHGPTDWVDSHGIPFENQVVRVNTRVGVH